MGFIPIRCQSSVGFNLRYMAVANRIEGTICEYNVIKLFNISSFIFKRFKIGIITIARPPTGVENVRSFAHRNNSVNLD